MWIFTLQRTVKDCLHLLYDIIQGRGMAKPEVSPVVWKAKMREGGCRVHSLVGEIVDGYDAASVLVDPIPPVLARQVGRHQACVPVVGNEQHIFSVRKTWRRPTPASDLLLQT